MSILKTIVVSDIHLGNPYSNWRKLERFLKENPCENLILNGDIIDERYLNSNFKKLNESELYFFNWLMSFKNVIYIIGNHEEFNHDISRRGEYWKKYNAYVYEDYIYSSLDGDYYISHGHKTIFKNFVTDNPVILNFIDMSIRFLAKLQEIHKGFLFEKGKFDIEEGVEFEILSKDSRRFFKTGLKIISNYKRKIKQYIKFFDTECIICGHIHHPEIKNYYMNSGDWVDNDSVLIQDNEGDWKIRFVL